MNSSTKLPASTHHVCLENKVTFVKCESFTGKSGDVWQTYNLKWHLWAPTIQCKVYVKKGEFKNQEGTNQVRGPLDTTSF